MNDYETYKLCLNRDVAGCEFAGKPINDNRIKCHCAKGLLQLAKMQEQPESIKSGLCENNPNCYYKQLKRLEQENNILKEKLQIAQNSDKKTLDILQENLHLKEQLEPFKDKYFKGLTNGTIAGLAKKSIRMTAENTKYTNFLEWLLTQQYYILPPKIKTRINEVLNETAK